MKSDLCCLILSLWLSPFLWILRSRVLNAFSLSSIKRQAKWCFVFFSLLCVASQPGRLLRYWLSLFRCLVIRSDCSSLRVKSDSWEHCCYFMLLLALEDRRFGRIGITIYSWNNEKKKRSVFLPRKILTHPPIDAVPTHTQSSHASCKLHAQIYCCHPGTVLDHFSSAQTYIHLWIICLLSEFIYHYSILF